MALLFVCSFVRLFYLFVCVSLFFCFASARVHFACTLQNSRTLSTLSMQIHTPEKIVFGFHFYLSVSFLVVGIFVFVCTAFECGGPFGCTLCTQIFLSDFDDDDDDDDVVIILCK